MAGPTRLIIDIGILMGPSRARSMAVAATLDDQLRYEQHAGAPVLLAGRLAEGVQHECVARGRFTGFSYDETGLPKAHLTEITWFRTQKASPYVDGAGAFIEIDEHVFAQLDEVVQSQLDVEEAGTAILGPDVYAAIAQQVRLHQQSVCCFRGKKVEFPEGAATPIRPRDSGGEIHVRNFLYLENEVARLFATLAWTVGPEHEIIVDASRVRAVTLAAMGSDGCLTLLAEPDWWPDADALSWHRKQFFNRINERN